jgi:hypothetical protein
MTLYIDYAWTHPNAQAIYDAGYRGVMRYLSHDTRGKDLSIAEAAALHKAGLGIGLVWETTADRARAGEAAGKSDAAEANAKADALGFPTSCPIFYAVDYDAVVNDITGYFIGIGNVTGRPVGVYGSYYVVKAMMAAYANYGWQTMAWSGGQKLSTAHLFQNLNHTWPIAGVANSAWDENVLLNPFPLWTATMEDDMPLTDADIDKILNADKVPSNTIFTDNPTVAVKSALGFVMQWSLQGRNAAQAAARDSAAALEIVKTFASTPGDTLTEQQIEDAAERGAQKAIDAEITGATVALNVTQPSA